MKVRILFLCILNVLLSKSVLNASVIDFKVTALLCGDSLYTRITNITSDSVYLALYRQIALISIFRVIRSSGERYMDEEALRVVQSMPKWTPGYKDDKPVRVYFSIPVMFRLQ